MVVSKLVYEQIKYFW